MLAFSWFSSLINLSSQNSFAVVTAVIDSTLFAHFAHRLFRFQVLVFYISSLGQIPHLSLAYHSTTAEYQPNFVVIIDADCVGAVLLPSRNRQFATSSCGQRSGVHRGGMAAQCLMSTNCIGLVQFIWCRRAGYSSDHYQENQDNL